MKVVRGFPSSGIVAGFEETAGGGDWKDINAARNAPALDPASHLDKVYFHSELDYYRIATMGSTTISHAAVAGVTGNRDAPPASVVSLGNMAIVLNGQVVEATHTLVTHGLGYVPKFFVAYNGAMIPAGVPVQQDDANRVRFVCAFATSSIIGLKEIGYSSDLTLSAASRTYDYLVFETVAQDPGLALMSGGPGFVQLGRGMIDTTKRMLRVARTGDSPYGIAMGPTAGYGNGGLRVARPDGTTIDYGAYSGGFSAPATVSVGL